MADAEEIRNEIRYAPPSPRSGVALPVGNHPGNTGGVRGRSGRRPGWATQVCREEFLARIPRLAQIADGKIPDATVGDQLRAIDLLGRYGEGSRIDASEVREALGETLAVLRAALAPELYDRLVDLIRPIWTHTHRRTR